MNADDHRLAIVIGHERQAAQKRLEALRRIDVLCSMQSHKKIFSGCHIHTRKHVARFDVCRICLQDFENRVAGHEDPLALDPFAHEVLFAALRVRHQHITAMIDDATIDLLGHAIVITAIPRLHMKDWNAHARR